MLTRVATFSTGERMLAATMRAQSRMVAAQLQEATGLVSTDYAGLGTAAGRVVDLSTAVARLDGYADAADGAGARVEVMYDAVGQMAGLLQELRSDLTQASGTDGTADLPTRAAALLEEFESLLDTRSEGRYLFAGGLTETAPVDVDAADYAAVDLAAASTGYYAGDDTVAGVRVSDDTVIGYGVTANDPAFEQALRVLAVLARSDTDDLDAATLASASDLAVEALDAVLAVQGRLSTAAGALERAAAKRRDEADFTRSLVDDATAVDVTALAARLSTYQAQLEASYAAIGKIQSLSLLDFLR